MLSRGLKIGGSDWMTYFCDLGKETFPNKR